MNKMNPIILSQIINDCWDAIENSKIGSIYVLDENGKIKRTPEGVAICSTVAIQTFHLILNKSIPTNLGIEGLT